MTWREILKVIACLLILIGHSVRADAEVTPDQLQFRRQAVQRMIFDRSQHIPLAALQPEKIVALDLMHPSTQPRIGQTSFVIKDGKLRIDAEQAAVATRWIGGFNPFATYDLSVDALSGSGAIGMLFGDPNNDDRITASLIAKDGTCEMIRWIVIKDGQEVERIDYDLPPDLKPTLPIRLRVQMLAVGANLYIEQSGRSELIAYPDFVQHFELRRKTEMRRFEFCLHTDLRPGASIAIGEATAALTPGCGQADIRAITRSDGAPLLNEGRLWLTMTVRGRALPHPLQGVFSFNPSVFDLRFEGIIVFDMGDGLLRNELASHLFYDESSGEWRGWTTGFSALGTQEKAEEKSILAVTSKRDPRRGFSVMNATPIGLQGGHEDPHGVYDVEAGKWRLLLSERAGKYRAGMWESDRWDRGYTRLAGPVPMDSTGTLIQKIGSKRYAMFGSADRKVYIRSYPNLEPAGELKMHRRPWNDGTGTRIWPNVIPLPPGYPARYIALMMDRINYPGMPDRNWSYGAMYLYHAHAPDGDWHPYEYQDEP